jgi:hypothetical protein
MALHVRPEIWELYPTFYAFAQEGTVPPDTECLLLTDADDAALAEAVAQNTAVQAICITGGSLTTLAPLEFCPALQWVRVERCPRLRTLWAMSATPLLKGLALVRCKRLCDLFALADAPLLEHLYVQNNAWDAAALDSAMPLAGLHALRTLDLAYKKVRDKNKLAFNKLYPQLDALTITPGLRRAFRTENEVDKR